MLTRTLIIMSFAAMLALSVSTQRASKRSIACKTAENAPTCYWTHGRLANYDGIPTLRLWKIGTKRILAIHSGPGFNAGDFRENENPEVPANVERAFKSFGTRVFADFEVCPLESERSGEMQDACIESAKHLYVEP